MGFLMPKQKNPPPIAIPAATPVPSVPTPPVATATNGDKSTAVIQTPPPQAQDPIVSQAKEDERRRRIRAAAGNNTLVTGGQGLIYSTPKNKTSFGQ